MSSRKTTVIALGLLTVLAACGRRGDPSPPLRFIPATTQDLVVAQRGRELLLTLKYPATTSAGMALPKLEWVELWELVRSVPPPAEGETVRAPNAQEFQARAQLVETFRGEDLTRLAVGERLLIERVLREAGDTLAGGTPEAIEARSYAVRSAVSDRDVSEFSNLVTVVPVLPPPAPVEGFTTEPRGDGVRLAWRPPASGPPAVGYRVYRRAPQDRSWHAPLHTTGADATDYLDTTARLGERYVYGVTAVHRATPLIESAPAALREVDYTDRFAPPVPTDLVALAEPGRVRLVWQGRRSPDLAGYRVYRRPADAAAGAFAPLGGAEAALATRAEATDTTVTAGASYVYRVTAVDRDGNESAPGNEARAELP
jgi:hypothetical protein